MVRKAVFLIAILGAYAVQAPAAQAQATRTFVSGHGTDSGTCSVTAPCRSFAYAITQTAATGEIVVLDSAGYGPITIGQSVSITNPGGVEAGITATAGSNAVTINTNTAANVTLRGLTLEGGGVGANGIDVISNFGDAASGGVVNVISCIIKDFSNDGILFKPTSSNSASTVNLMITDSFILENANDGVEFVSEILTLSPIYRTVITGNGSGIATDATNFASGTVALFDSHVDYNQNSGIYSLAGNFTLKNSSSQDLINYNNIINISNASSVGIIYNYGGTVSVFEGNTIGSLNNNNYALGTATTYTDGTNHFGGISGNPLTLSSPQ